MVVLIFLRTVRATIIAGVALPLSLIATFGVMWFCGFSLDNLSLMALTIGTGFVVDDAIVMIENIVRHMEEGEDPFEAALEGAREIGFTVISLTVSLIAVFIPLLFMTGLVGRMFREFALTLTIAVVTSAVVSLTLTPMMCSRLLRHNVGVDRQCRHARLQPRRRLDRRGLPPHASNGCCGTRALTLLVTVGTLVATVWLYIVIPKGFLPLQDTGLIFAVMEGGEEVSFAEMQRLRAPGRDRDPQGSRRDRRRLGGRRDAGQRHAECRPARDHAAPARRARSDAVTTVIERLQDADRADPGRDDLLPAGAGHPDLDAHEPRAVPVHAHRRRRQGGEPVGRPARRQAAVVAGAARRRLRSAGPRPAHDSSRSTASSPAGSASRCRPSTTRSTTPSASARFRPSTASPTSTA